MSVSQQIILMGSRMSLIGCTSHLSFHLPSSRTRSISARIISSSTSSSVRSGCISHFGGMP